MSQTTTAPLPTKVITGPKTRLSYAKIWKPEAMEEGQEPKYSVSLIIPKDDTETLDKIKAAIAAARKAGESKLSDAKGKALPESRLKLPLRDGDEERSDDENYAGCYFLNATSKTKPGIVSLEKDADGKFKEIKDEAEVYSGCYGRVSINFYAFNTKGNAGIAVGLNNIQKVKDGEPLGGRSNADADFNDGFEPEQEDDFL